MTKEPDLSGFASVEAAAFWRYMSSSLNRFEHALQGRSIEELNWRPPAPGANTLYELATHSLGHLRQGVLEGFGGQTLGRDRDSEFASVATRANVPIPAWASTREAMRQVLAALPSDALTRVWYPPGREPLTGLDFLIVMARHTAEHVGHAELTRDLALAAGKVRGRSTNEAIDVSRIEPSQQKIPPSFGSAQDRNDNWRFDNWRASLPMR